MANFKHGDFVTYDAHGTRVSARVQTAHRDGTYTVRAWFSLNADGSDNVSAGFLGYVYRRMPARLFAAFH